jgi:hypothetical protein
MVSPCWGAQVVDGLEVLDVEPDHSDRVLVAASLLHLASPVAAGSVHGSLVRSSVTAWRRTWKWSSKFSNAKCGLRGQITQ